MVKLRGTKEIIFDAALQLFSGKGFETANMRDLAAMCNIKAASIYNHFSGKQEILDTAYDYFSEHFFHSAMPDAEMKRIIMTGTKEEILKAMILTFESGGEKEYLRMVLIAKIVYMRIFDDERAKNLFSRLMNAEPENYLVELFEYGIQKGRFKPFDCKTYAQLLIGCRHSMALKAFASPEYVIGHLEEETRLDMLLRDLLPMAGEAGKMKNG